MSTKIVTPPDINRILTKAKSVQTGLDIYSNVQRVIGSPNERARQAVTKAIRQSIQRIAAADPVSGRHLQRTVRTGQYCVYDPDPAATPSWEL